MRSISERTLIGWREWAAFPNWGVAAIKAKVDTGAKTSAVHAFDIAVNERRGSVTFLLAPMQRRKAPVVVCRARLLGRRRIRCSNGALEERYVVRTMIALGDARFSIELSLADRDEMGFRLLLGRDALKRRFLVDPGASFLLGE